jgi:hypothetical protein
MKSILLLAAGLLLAGTVSAQRLYGPLSDYSSTDFYESKFGFEASVNVSNAVGASSSSNFNAGSLTGFTAGATYELPVIYPFSLQSALLYSQKGYSAETASGNFTQRTEYIDIPVLAKFKIVNLVNLYLGPQLSFLASTSNTFSAGFNDANKQYYQSSNVNRTNFDGVIGVGIDVSRNFDIHARYNVDLNQTSANGNQFVPGYSNQVVQLGLGFKF